MTTIAHPVSNQWVPELKRYLPRAPFIIVGCKTDLRGSGVACITPEQVCVSSPKFCCQTQP
jgi:hypothetical protein